MDRSGALTVADIARRDVQGEIMGMREPFHRMLANDAWRIQSVTLVGGESVGLLDTDDARRLVEVGPDWLLVRSGYGENERVRYIALASIATVTLNG